MKQDKKIVTAEPAPGSAGLGIGFAVIWAVVLAMVVPGPEKGPLEDASTYSGTLFGFGLFFGLISAFATHFLFLRKHKRNIKVLAYALGGFLGGLTAVVMQG